MRIDMNKCSMPVLSVETCMLFLMGTILVLDHEASHCLEDNKQELLLQEPYTRWSIKIILSIAFDPKLTSLDSFMSYIREQSPHLSSLPPRCENNQDHDAVSHWLSHSFWKPYRDRYHNTRQLDFLLVGKSRKLCLAWLKLDHDNYLNWEMVKHNLLVSKYVFSCQSVDDYIWSRDQMEIACILNIFGSSSQKSPMATIMN